MRFYSSVVQHKGDLLVTFFENGRRLRRKVKYQPYLFVDDPDGDHETVFGQPVSKIKFDSIWDAVQAIKRYKDVTNFRFHGTSNWYQQYIYHTFPDRQFDRNLLNIGFLDIETSTDGGFPDIEIADQMITMISVEVGGHMHSFGLKDFDTTNIENITYHKFDSEEAMLRKFVRVWQQLELDILTGWNIQGFDIPYIIRRITRVLGEEVAKKLSPYGVITSREYEIYGQKKTAYTILGIADLDYIELYKKFTVPLKGRPESFSLDYISHLILGVRKLDYSEYGDLQTLYEENPQLYAEYNVRDVVLVRRIDEAMGLIDIALTIAYQTGVNIGDVFGTVKPWDSAIHWYLMDQKRVVPFEKLSDVDFKIEGGYVKEVITGSHKWVASFDFASLYPHVIMMWNIGPETFKRRINNIRAEPLATGSIDLSGLLGPNEVLGGNGCVFDTSRKSFLAALMEEKFADRTRYRKALFVSKQAAEDATTPEEKARHEADAARYDNLQHATKILLNSVYGALANLYFRWFDVYMAECITQSGQTATRSVEIAVNRKLNKILKTKEFKDFIVAIDTDSIYVSLETLIEAVATTDMTVDQKISLMDQICKTTLTPTIDETCQNLANILQAPHNKLNMKREVLASRGIWTGKKHYILLVYDEEGVRYTEPKKKITGIEAVRSSSPAAAREKIREALDIILSGTNDELITFLADARKEYQDLPIPDIAFPRGTNDIDKWKSNSALFSKGCPIHAKAAILHNLLLKQLNITEFNEIQSGDKIKFAQLKQPNPYRIPVIGFSSILPPQFKLDEYVDRTTLFDKGLLEPLKTITNVIGWSVDNKPTLDRFFS